MDPVFYSVEGCIQQFFESLTTATRAECDIKATSLIGAPVRPMPIQGSWSYTVTGESSDTDVVQFRAGRSKLNMKNVNIAMEVHTKYVPQCIYLGQIGGRNPLSVYVMEKCSGVCYIQARNISMEGKAEFETRQFRTVGDLASFFAEAWKGAQQVSLTDVSDLRQEIEIDLD
ncbi:hypothetical protein FPOA_00051 [Fusarium poae]|uniref:Uncharacterized protein n=1 Tax=Fusarium poae TaxID=36050 RepID=A0A1B8B045_FUSPO|nr:hypothetical protein FPOA_00051 [Fusarium poae]